MPASTPLLQVVEFQTVAHCNARCTICPWPIVGTLQRPRAMSEPIWIRLVDELAVLRPRRVIPYLNNEPLLDLEIVRKVAELRDRLDGPEIELSTNGMLLTAERSEALFQAGVTELLISVFGTEPEAHRRVMGLDHVRVRRHVERALEMRDRWAPRALVKVIQVALPSVDPAVWEQGASNWRALGAEVETYGYLDRAGNVAEEIAGAPQRDRRIPPAGCELNRHRERMYVLTDGTLLLCCHDWRAQLPVGNLMVDGLEATWKSERYRLLRAQVDGTEPSDEDLLCRRCKLCPEK